MNERFIKTVVREVYTIEEAAFAMHVGRNTFKERFVDTGKIVPVIYDEEQGDDLYFDVDDIKILIKKSKRVLLDGYGKTKIKRAAV